MFEYQKVKVIPFNSREKLRLAAGRIFFVTGGIYQVNEEKSQAG
jgi:hypothetical protein